MDSPENFDRAHHLRDDLDRLEQLLDAPTTWVLPLHSGRALLSDESPGQLAMRRGPDGGAIVQASLELVFLGLLDGEAVFAADLSRVDEHKSLPKLVGPHRLADLRLALPHLDPVEAHLAAYARALFHFHSSHAHCGHCGGETRPRKGGHSRLCSGCQREVFPRTDPAILVLVHHQGRILLGRQHGWPSGMYSTLAGFVEPGESVEEAVRREVFEETGITLRALSYRHSQPWPFPGSLMLGFVAEAESDGIVLDDELEDARFFSVEELRSPTVADFFTPGPKYLAGRLISAFLEGGSG